MSSAENYWRRRGSLNKNNSGSRKNKKSGKNGTVETTGKEEAGENKRQPFRLLDNSGSEDLPVRGDWIPLDTNFSKEENSGVKKSYASVAASAVDTSYSGLKALKLKPSGKSLVKLNQNLIVQSQNSSNNGVQRSIHGVPVRNDISTLLLNFPKGPLRERVHFVMEPQGSSSDPLVYNLRLEYPEDLSDYLIRRGTTVKHHNEILAEFYRNGLKDPESFFQRFRRLVDLGGVETELICRDTLVFPTIIFNLAVLYFHHRRYEEARRILQRLILCDKGTDKIKICVRELHMAILVREQRMKEGQLQINILESHLPPLEKLSITPATTCGAAPNEGIKKKKKKKLYALPDDLDQIRLRLLLQSKKTECLLQAKELPDAKKEYKLFVSLVNSSPRGKEESIDQLIVVQTHLKAYLEYLSGHYDNAIRLICDMASIGSIKSGVYLKTNPELFKTFVETGDNLNAIFKNNAACCYYAMRKPCVSKWYLQEAGDLCDDKSHLNRKELPMHCLSNNLKYEVMYNFALANLHSPSVYGAFYYFWILAQFAYPSSSKLWLNLAQSTVRIHDLNNGPEPCPEKSFADPFEEFKTVCPSSGEKLPFPPNACPPTPTLCYGMSCITKALELIGNSALKENGKCLVDASPFPQIRCMKEVKQLLNTIYITGSYIALMERNYTVAAQWCFHLLKESTKASDIQIRLAHLYLVRIAAGIGNSEAADKLYQVALDKSWRMIRPDNSCLDLEVIAGRLAASYKDQRVHGDGIQPKYHMDAHDALIYNRALILVIAGKYEEAKFLILDWFSTVKDTRELSKLFKQLYLNLDSYLSTTNKRKPSS